MDPTRITTPLLILYDSVQWMSGSPTFSKSAWCSVTTPNGGTSDPPKIVWSPISLVAWIDSINRGKTVTEPVCPVEIIGGASGSSLGLGLRPWLPSTSLGTSSSSSSTSSSSSSTWTCDGRSSSWCLSMEKIYDFFWEAKYINAF